MRVLFLTQAFPPHPEVGAIRSANLVQAFREAGHQVTVITEAVPDSPPVLPEGPGPPVRVIPVEAGSTYAVRVGKLVRPIRRMLGIPPLTRSDAEESTGHQNVEPPRGIGQLVLAALSIPDGDNHLIGPFYAAARSALEQGTDLIYSSAPPFSLHLCAKRLRGQYAIPWVAEFRDPWQHPWTRRPADLHSLTRGINRRLERGVLETADVLVMATEAAREFIAQKLPSGKRAGILVARNGIPDWSESERPPRPAGRTAPFRIVHPGSFYMGRNPTGFFEGLALLIERIGLQPADLQVEFIGKSRQSEEQLLERLGLSEYVTIEGWIPHAEARARLFAADALLLFAQDQPLQVPNKLYEYLAVGSPILAFVDREGESARILRDSPESQLFFDPSAEPIADALATLLATRGADRQEAARSRLPESMSSRVQMRELVETLTRRFGKGAGAVQG